MLFTDSVDSDVLAVMGLSIFFTSIFLTTSAILHGLNKVHVTVVHVFVGLIVKTLLNVLLIPLIGTLGAATATVIACMTAACLNLFILRYIEALPSFSNKRVMKVTFMLVLMGLCTFLWKEGSVLVFSELAFTRIGNTFIAITSVAMGTLVFLIGIIVGKIFSEDELAHIPKIRKLAVFMQSKKGE
jgi:polysaccharide transporter, PST family